MRRRRFRPFPTYILFRYWLWLLVWISAFQIFFRIENMLSRSWEKTSFFSVLCSQIDHKCDIHSRASSPFSAPSHPDYEHIIGFGGRYGSQLLTVFFGMLICWVEVVKMAKTVFMSFVLITLSCLWFWSFCTGCTKVNSHNFIKGW